MSFNGSYFLSGQSKIHKVKVELSSSILTIKNGDEVLNSYDLKKCKVSTIISGIPIEVTLPDRGRLEIENTNEILQKIQDLNILKHYSPYFLENKLKYFVVGLVLTVAIFFVSFKYVIPTMSRQVANIVPNGVAVFLDERIESQLDQFIFKESKLDNQLKEKLKKYFNDHGLEKIKVKFRKGDRAQANAFALAGESIFFTDEIIELMNNDRYLLAIAYHETGHLERRHVLSTIIKDSFVFLLTMIYLGDLPGAADNLMQVGLVLYSHDHSRKFEREADEYAIKQLAKYNMSPKCFTEGMDKLHEHYGSKLKAKDLNDPDIKKEDMSDQDDESIFKKYKLGEKLKSAEKVVTKYLSTHPSLKERTTDILKKYPDAKDCNGSKIITEATK